jgi:hypothetical protein
MPNVVRFPSRMFVRITAYGINASEHGGSPRIAD